MALYLLNRFHELVFTLFVFLLLRQQVKNLVEILFILFFLLVINDFLQSVEVIVLKHVEFEVLEFLVAKGAAVVPAH